MDHSSALLRALPPAFLLLLTAAGCLSTGTSSQLGEKLDSASVSIREARATNMRLAYRDGLTVERAADSIIAVAPDSATRMNALIWKTYSIPVIRQIYGQQDPFAAILDALAFSKQCEDYFSTGIGRDRFGEFQGIAVEAMRENTRRLYDATARILKATSHDTLVNRTTEWVGRHPLTNHLFERSSVLLELESALWEQDYSIGSAVGRIADDVDDLSGRLSLLSAQLPREARWQGEYLVNDLALKERLAGLDQTIRILSTSLKGIEQQIRGGGIVVDIEGLRSLHDDLTAALERVSAERAIVLAEVDRQRLHTLATVERRVGEGIDAAFIRIDDLLDRLLLRIGIGLAILLVAAALFILLLRRGLGGVRQR